jgi:hypothetical protein
MLKRFSSLILVLMLGGSVLVGTARLQKEHVCELAGVGMMPGMETMPCYKEHQSLVVLSESRSSEQCCVIIPQETGSRGTTFNLSSPSFSIAVIHPAIAQSPISLPKLYERPYSTRFFLPNLQATYIRNFSFLI